MIHFGTLVEDLIMEFHLVIIFQIFHLLNINQPKMITGILTLAQTLFPSSTSKPFLVPVTPPGEDPNLDSAVALFCDGSYSVCLLPGVWHEGVYPIEGNGRFLTRQGRVHGRISADLSQEFGCLLRMSLLSKDFPEH